MERRKVVIISDCLSVRTSISKIIQSDGRYSVLTVASTNVEAIFRDPQLQAFVIYHDDASENTSATIKKIHDTYVHARIVLLSPTLEKMNLRTFVTHGLTGFFYINELEHTVHQVMDVIEHGYHYFDYQAITFILSDYQNMLKNGQEDKLVTKTGKEQFTDREMDVLQLLANGCSNQEIAKGLYLSKYTVYNHIRNIIMKMGVQDRTAAAVYAIKHQLVTLDDRPIPAKESNSAGQKF